MRVVSGTASSGGSSSFTSVFASRTPSGSVSVSGSNSGGSVSNHTLNTSRIPSHSHSVPLYFYDASGPRNYFRGSYPTTGQGNRSTNSTGGGGSHNHGFTNPSWSGSASFSGSSMDFAVQYVDLIIAALD